MTAQRQLILETVQGCHFHPTAAEIYDIVHKEHSVSMATVYNSLNYLVENGYIMRVAIAGEADRFDFNLKEHQHAKCDKCNRIFDVEVHGIVESIQAAYGIKVTSFGINLHCICKDCREKN